MTTRTAVRATKISLEPKHEPTPALLAELATITAGIAGMQASMLDRRNLRQTLKQRAEATGLDPEAYVELCKQSPEEQSSFLEGVLNGETSFFRDATVFAELSRWCLNWFARNNGTLRILSAPCSTGEEPYSIAAMLEQSGIRLERFTLEAIDLSSLAIERARIAVYNGLSLRNLPEPEQSGFLERVPKGWRVKQHLRDHVAFRQANLLTPDTLEPKAYDLICSRNLLIYQSNEARTQMAASLAQALAPGGRLVIGAADWGRDLDAFFRLEEPVNSFALRLRDAAASTTPKLGAPGPDSRPRVGKGATSDNLHSISAPKPSAPAPTTAKARRILDLSNQLAHVTALYRNALEAYLRAEEREAERLCRQTLYLETDHLPSLELLAKINRPQASNRMQLALHARLKRHRTAAAEGGAP